MNRPPNTGPRYAGVMGSEIHQRDDMDKRDLHPKRTSINIVFDGPPSHKSGRFVEVEDADGRSFNAGEWLQEGDLWVLALREQPAPVDAS